MSPQSFVPYFYGMVWDSDFLSLVPGALQQDSAAGRATGTLVSQHPPLLDSFTLYDPVMPPLVAHMVKNLPAMQDIWVRSLGQEDPLEKETATHSSTLAWRILSTEEPGGLQSTGLPRVRHD